MTPVLGLCHKVVELDKKKRSDSEYIAFEFHTKKISLFGIDSDILFEIHKFPYPIQQLITDEFCAVEGRIENGKPCQVLCHLTAIVFFFCQYLLLCRHIFYEHVHGSTRLLTNEAWLRFQQMFEEASFDIYMHRELIEIRRPQRIEAEKAMESRHLVVNELIEQIRDVYWQVEKKGNFTQTNAFVQEFNVHLEHVLNKNNGMLV
ncbi:hypothetical protein C2G38_2028579 [Gigaspora rosea]|uniref:Uncharacterized protein n=1 Tax=Gigaspora rosea TaxID=44941 RepID=A0A397W2H2_9GLOM|nr:hypothetical protein C2G38_2028579 [Gigaspora rosea]